MILENLLKLARNFKSAKLFKEATAIYKLASVVSQEWNEAYSVLNDYLESEGIQRIEMDVDGMRRLIAYQDTSNEILKELAINAWDKTFHGNLILKAFEKAIHPFSAIAIGRDLLNLMVAETDLEQEQPEVQQFVTDRVTDLSGILNNYLSAAEQEGSNYIPESLMENLNEYRVGFWEQIDEGDNYLLFAMKDLAGTLGHYNKNLFAGLGQFVEEYFGPPERNPEFYKEISAIIKKHLNLDVVLNESVKGKTPGADLNEDQILAKNPIISSSILRRLINKYLPLYQAGEEDYKWILEEISRNPNTSADDLDHLFEIGKNIGNTMLIGGIARNKSTSPTTLIKILNDPNTHPALKEILQKDNRVLKFKRLNDKFPGPKTDL